VELREVFNHVQGSLDRGEYATVVDACTRVLDVYPSCVTAHRMLGEAWLEQGQVDSAQEHFARTLAIDPLNVVARLGLGVVAEERHDLPAAYKHYLNAWEVNPVLDQLRDELVRVQGHLGGDARIHPTRSALAVIYGRGGHRERALREWRVVVGADANNVRAGLSLAELLWDMGDTAGAKATCDRILAQLPEAARALLILACIDEHQAGHVSHAIMERYLAVDPAAELATAFVEGHPATRLKSIIEAAVTIDAGAVFAPAVAEVPPGVREDVVVEAQRPAPPAHRPPLAAPTSSKIAAPDLWAGLEGLDGAGATAGQDLPVEPFAWDDLAGQTEGGFADLPAMPSSEMLPPANLIGTGSGLLSGDDLDAVFGREFADSPPPASWSSSPPAASPPAPVMMPSGAGDHVPPPEWLAGLAPESGPTGIAPRADHGSDLGDLGVTPFSFDLDPASPGTLGVPAFGDDIAGDIVGTTDPRSAFDFGREAEIEPFNFDLDTALGTGDQDTFGMGGESQFSHFAEPSRRVSPPAGPPPDAAFGSLEDLLSAAASDDRGDGPVWTGGPGATPAVATRPVPEESRTVVAPWAAAEVQPITTPPASPGPPAMPRQDMMQADQSAFVQNDGRIDLTLGWDDLDRALADATPPSTSVGGYDDLLLDLSADGIAPLEIGDLDDDDAWEPLSAEDWDTEDVPVAAAFSLPVSIPGPSRHAGSDAVPETVPDASADAWSRAMGADGATGAAVTEDVDPFDFDVLDPSPRTHAAPATTVPDPGDQHAAGGALRITVGWDDIDAELERAIPRGSMNGYTELLKNLDSEHPMPFPAVGFGGVEPEVDPLAATDVAGDQIDFEDLLAVTSEDHTAPLSHTGSLGPAIEALADATVTGSDPDQSRDHGQGQWLSRPSNPDTDRDQVMDPFTFVERGSSASDSEEFEAFYFSDLDGPSGMLDNSPVAADDGESIPSWHGLLTSDSDQATAALFSGSEAATAALFSRTESDPVVTDLGAGSPMGGPAPTTRAFSLDDLVEGSDLTQSQPGVSDMPWPRPAAPASRQGVPADQAPVTSPEPGRTDRGAGRPRPADVAKSRAEHDPRQVTSPWPPFDTGAVSLVQIERFDLFGRLREEKDSLVALGMLAVKKTIESERTGGDAEDALVPHRADESRPVRPQTGGLSAEQLQVLRADIAGTRSDVLSAVATLERLAEAGGGTQVQRLLGEGYLRLGRSADAAEQFRLAMSYQARDVRGTG